MANNKKITLTMYYTTCSIMFQGSKKAYKEFNDMTPAEWIAKEVEKISAEIVKTVNVKEIGKKMKADIENWRIQESVAGKSKAKGKGKNTASGKVTISCIKCSSECKDSQYAAAYF